MFDFYRLDLVDDNFIMFCIVLNGKLTLGVVRLCDAGRRSHPDPHFPTLSTVYMTPRSDRRTSKSPMGRQVNQCSRLGLPASYQKCLSNAKMVSGWRTLERRQQLKTDYRSGRLLNITEHFAHLTRAKYLD